MKELKICPICNSYDIEEVTQRKGVSPYQNKLFNSEKQSKEIQKVNLNICICKNCGFIFNSEFNEDLELYDFDYNNDQNSSGIFKDYIDKSSEYLVNNYLKDGNRILEIGCGKNGIYLKNIFKHSKLSIEAIGYDPSYTGQKELFDGRLKYYSEFYDFSDEQIKNIDLVISRHVIEHISKPNNMLNNFKNLFNMNSELICFIETPNVEWILENGTWFDFFHEHCSYFSPYSLEIALKINGLYLKKIQESFDGQYMIAIIGNNKEKDIKYDEKEISKLINKVKIYSQQEESKIINLKKLLNQLKIEGNVALWGAGAKANTFVNILDNKKEYINSIIDINPSKLGKFIAGTGHLIISPSEILDRNIKNIIIMNNNYYNEIEKLLMEKSINANLIKL